MGARVVDLSRESFVLNGGRSGVGLAALPLRGVSRPYLESGGVVRKRSGVRRHLVLMVKDPSAGRVKTRLARGLGNVRATQFYRNASNAVLARVTHAGCWHTYLAISPDAALESRAWSVACGRSEVWRMGQGVGNLGQRMQRVMDGMPPGPVVIVGSDVPMIERAHISSAFARLGGADGVFGPSPDGGYWLVGMKRTPRVIRAFDGVRWSTPDTLADTMANFKNMRVVQVDALDDVDDAQDFARIGASAGRRVLPKV